MKDCLIIGPATALHYNDVYPLLRDKVIKVEHRGDLKLNGKTVYERLIIRRKQL